MMGTIQVLPAGATTSTTLNASATDVNVNSTVTLTATVTPASTGGPALTGTVQFAEDGTDIGSPVIVSGGQATLTTTLSSSGSHTFTALYSGDANYDESVSSAFDIGVEDFALSAAAATVGQPGQSGTAAISVTDSANFTAPVNFTCALPNSLVEAACFVNPNTITGSGQVSLTVNTTPPHALVHPGPRVPPFGPASRISIILAALLLCALLLAIAKRQWRVPTVVGLGMLAVLLFAASCGGGSGNASDPGTPAGTYSVVVTGSSGSGSTQIQHTVLVPLTIQ